MNLERLSQEKNLTVNDFMESDIPTLVECLKQHNNTILQFKAAWALTNIVWSSSEQANQVVAAGAVPLLMQLFSSPAPEVREQAVWALGNIIGDGPELRDYVIQHGVVQPLLSFIKPDIPILFLFHVVWVITNLCRSKDSPPPTTTILEILPALNVLIHHTDTNILHHTVWAIVYLTDGGNDQIKMVIQSNVVPKLIFLLGHTVEKVQFAALRAVSNITTGSDEQTQVVLKCSDAFTYFPVLLTHAREKVRKETFSIISNICDLLACQDTKIICIVLDGLNNMLKVSESHVQAVVNLIEKCDGLRKIEILQAHDNVEIYTLAYEIIEQYFSRRE